MIRKSESNSAISPVLGTILLIAITVALIAIITAVVLGMSGEQNKKEVGIGIIPGEKGDANVILYNGASIAELVKLEVLDAGSPRGQYVTVWNISESNELLSGGEILFGKRVARPLRDMQLYATTIIIRGLFSDGTEQILFKGPAEFHDPVSMPEYLRSIVFGTNLTDRYRETITGYGPLSSRDASTAGYALYANLFASLAAETDANGAYTHRTTEPYPVSHYIFEMESIHPDRNEAYSTYFKTGELTKVSQNTYYWVTWHITNRDIYSGVPNAKGPWKFTLTVYGTDGSILASEYWYAIG